MSKESREWLSTMTLIGYTAKRGHAWHYRQGDGNHFEGPVPLEEVESRLFDWVPVDGEISVTFTDPVSGEIRVIHDEANKAIVNPKLGKVLQYPTVDYRSHEYREWLVHNVGTLLDTSTSDLGIASAGLLKGTAVAWVQFEMPENRSAAGMEYRPFLAATTSLDGSLATQYLRGSQLVVCDNTLSMALRGAKNLVKVKHTSQSLGKIGDVRDALQIIAATGDELGEELEQLAGLKVSDAELEAFFDAYGNGVTALVTPDGKPKEGRSLTMARNKRETMQRLYDFDQRVAPWRGTALGVMQMMSTYNHHEGTVRNVTRPERNLLNAIDGTTAKSDASVLKTLEQVLQQA